ncbi:hypothetical protein [Microlunatus sp. Y2014]|uniref:hypothetical protein n=1 Tax=Microlunatus sp. Y2014 TaxID=3418488 RepID=UPI003DA765CB
MARRLIILGVTTVVVGLLAGVLWESVTVLPGYIVAADGQAYISEQGLTRFIVADVIYAVIGLAVGIGLGIVCWFVAGRRWGWPVVPLAAVAALLAGLLCWLVGTALGPKDMAARAAAAQPGDVVEIDFALRSPVALAIWVLGAVGALLVITAVARDDEIGGEPNPPRSREPAGDVGTDG